jgi:hydrogenase nickel incorporation protein HypB
MSTRVIKIEQDILNDDKELAEKIRIRERENNRLMINVMASPGAGKTSLILALLERFKSSYTLSVLEGDVDSTVDSDKIETAGYRAVQIQTGGFCHLNPPMIEKGLALMERQENRELVFIENIGNLICPASHDLGETVKIVILSVPEGDDKPWKYPGIFRVADLVVLNKIDYPDYKDFKLKEFSDQLQILNPGVSLFPVSCKSEQGLEELVQKLESLVDPFFD